MAHGICSIYTVNGDKSTGHTSRDPLALLAGLLGDTEGKESEMLPFTSKKSFLLRDDELRFPGDRSTESPALK